MVPIAICFGADFTQFQRFQTDVPEKIERVSLRIVDRVVFDFNEPANEQHRLWSNSY